MIRLFGIAAGLLFAVVALMAFVSGAYSTATDPSKPTAPDVFHLPPHEPAGGYSFEGPFGTWDVAQLQRGYKVYKEVCSACHSMKYVAFRDLGEIGYDKGQVKAIAASVQVPGVNKDTGENVMRAGEPTDYFPSPFPNDVAAKAANGGKVPPDFSLITKAREGGPAYVYSLITGYRDPKTFKLKDGQSLHQEFPDWSLPPGTYFNPYFSALAIGMPPPLTTDGQVTFDDGTKATIPQMAKDVSAFLTWTAEPKLVKRRQVGWQVVLFLVFATVLAYLAKNHVWAAVKPKKKKVADAH